jgi:hypothetical protein
VIARSSRYGRVVVFPDDLRDVPSVRAVIDWLVAVWHAHDAALRGS